MGSSAIQVTAAGGGSGGSTVTGTHTPADAYTNPTDAVDSLGLLAGWNGVTWDRLRSSIANGLAVDVTRVQGSVAVTGPLTDTQLRASAVPVSGTFFQATQPVSGTFFQATQPVSIAATVTVDTELPAASALADADANPTTSRVGSNLLGFNGTTWDRLRSTVANGLAVDVTRVQGTVTVSGTTAATGADTAADAHANPTTALIADAYASLFNGTTWDRQRSAGSIGVAAVGGAAASGVAVAGNPLLDGARASQTLPTAVSAGQAVANWATFNGRQRVYASGRRRLGIYFAALGSTTVTLAADAATVGRFWIVNNTGATVFGAIRSVFMTNSTTTGVAETSAPVFNIERITFTGTPSGAAITPGKRDSNDPTATLSVRTASTGMTITAGAAMHGFQIAGALATTSATAVNQVFPYTMDEDAFVILRAGEGLVLRQATAGSTGDTRIANFDIIWEEFNSTDFAIND